MPAKKIPLPGIVFKCFGKRAHAAKCEKSCVLTKVIDTIIEIDSFEQHCVIIKGFLQSELLKQYMVIIGVD